MVLYTGRHIVTSPSTFQRTCLVRMDYSRTSSPRMSAPWRRGRSLASFSRSAAWEAIVPNAAIAAPIARDNDRDAEIVNPLCRLHLPAFITLRGAMDVEHVALL